MHFPPPLLLSRASGEQVIVAIVVPIIFGVICGATLVWNEPVYLVLQVLGIAGGLGAGFEHASAREGALRGLAGGALFGTFILLTAALIGSEAKAHLPEPQAVLPIVTTFFGVLLGAIGGRLRGRRDGREAAAPATA